MDPLEIQIIRMNKSALPTFASFGTMIIPLDADELYAGNGDQVPISRISEVSFVQNNAELNITPRIVNKFYVVKFDQSKNNTLTIHRWTGSYFYLFAQEHAKTIVSYLGLPDDGFEDFFVRNERFERTIGQLDQLTTTYKENVVGSINEVDDKTQIRWNLF